jgi:hypothetical protein
MHKGVKLLLIGSSLLFAAPVFAQGDGDATGAGAGSAAPAGGDATAAGGDATAGGAATTPAVGATGDAAAGTSTFSATGQLLDQQYVMDKGKVGAYGDLTIAHISLSGGGVSVSATQEGLHLGAGYGITDKITAGVDYAFPLAGDGTDNTKGKGPLSIFGGFLISHNDKLTVAASADFDYDLCGTADMMGNCSGTKALHAGLGLKYKVAPKVAIFTGAPFGPGPFGQHLSISLESSGPIDFNLPVGAAFQATPQIFAFAETNLAEFRLANAPMGADAVSPIFSDSEKGGIGVPLQLGGYYGVNKTLHVGANLEFPDLMHAGDFYAIFLGARFFQG